MPLPLTAPQLDRYFARLRYQGPRDVSLRTLRDLHRAHLLAIPYENLDIHLGVPITLDADTDTYAWTTTLRLAERFALTVYDAAYLELAQRRSLPLATLDVPLRVAAGALGVSLLGTAG